jgi:hypothetical protein
VPLFLNYGRRAANFQAHLEELMTQKDKDGPFPMSKGDEANRKLVSQIDSVTAKQFAGNKVSLIITAKGTVTTNAWRSPKLDPVRYVQPPKDGIFEFSFTAVDPGAGNDVMTPIEATYEWEHPPFEHIRGIRVKGQGNSKEVKYP